MTLQPILQRHKRQFVSAAQGVELSVEFDLALPVGFVQGNIVDTTTISGLGSRLNASAALSSPEIERFFLLRAQHGFDRAFELCSTDGEEGEAFCAAWDEAQSDLANGALATLGDLVAMVCKARSGWMATPRELLVVMVDGKRVESALVPTSWFLC